MKTLLNCNTVHHNTNSRNNARLSIVLAVVMILSGCSERVNVAQESSIEESYQPEVRTWAQALLDETPPLTDARLDDVVVTSASKDGKYYLDDGPPERYSPSQIAATPDAIPRVDKILPIQNSPYSINGKNYYPSSKIVPYRKQGIASWYGRRYHGNKTATGEVYDMFKMTAAHPTLAIPSYARVTRVADGSSVIVRVNDRGPFLHNRVIDLSFAAAYRLGIVDAGSGEVVVETITPSEVTIIQQAIKKEMAERLEKEEQERIAKITAEKVAKEEQERAAEQSKKELQNKALANDINPGGPALFSDEVVVDIVAQGKVPVIAIPSVANLSANAIGAEGAANQAVGVLPQLAMPSGFYVQLGAYKKPNNALSMRAELEKEYTLQVYRRQTDNLLIVAVGPYANKEAAEKVRNQLKVHVKHPFIVKLP